jgi:hypothetical protein
MAQGQHGQSSRGNDRDRRTAEEHQIAGAINSLHRDYNAAQQQRKEEGGEHLKWYRRTALTAFGYTIVTGFLLGAAVFSIYQTWNAIDAANRAADAATSQANTSNDTEKRQLRAYVGVQPGAIKEFGTKDQYISLLGKFWPDTSV